MKVTIHSLSCRSSKGQGAPVGGKVREKGVPGNLSYIV